MQSKHKIIGLTSLILTTTAGFVSAEPHKNTVNMVGSHYTAQLYLGEHGVDAGEGGESGEGGFDAVSLKTDDIAFGDRKAHV